VATDFEHRSFGQELALCQRYCQPYLSYFEYTSGATGNLGGPTVSFTTPMRAAPSFTVDNESKSSNWTFNSYNTSAPNSNERGFLYFQIVYDSSNSNNGYFRRYGMATSEL